MVSYGNGFTVSDLYILPTHLRSFYYKKLIEAKEREKKQYEDAQKSAKSKVRIKR